MGRTDNRFRTLATIETAPKLLLADLPQFRAAPPHTNSVTIEGIEVTQSVQSMNHDVPLIAGKRTIVRVYLSVSTNLGYGQISGRLLITSRLGPIFIDPASQSVSVLDQWNGNMATFKRKYISTSLNFEVPTFLLNVDTFNVQLVQVIDMYNDRADVPITNSSAMIRTVSFVDGAPLRLTVIGLQYTQGGNTFAPRQIDLDLIQSWFMRAYPITSLTFNTRTVNATNTPPFTAQQANAQVAQIRVLDVNGGTDKRTHYYGLVHDGGFFMRGLSGTPTSSPNPGAIGSGPTGSGTFGWDNDGSYGDWYTGHEIGHTLGRQHIGGTCGEPGPLDPSYPFPQGQISNASGDYVGLDVGDPRFSIPMQALDGTIWHDVMGYCSNQWLSSYTFAALRTRILAENAMPSSGRALAEYPDGMLAVIGLYFPERGEATITSVDRIEVGWLDEITEGWQSYSIDQYGRELTTGLVTVFDPSHDDISEPRLFVSLLPYADGISEIGVLLNGTQLGKVSFIQRAVMPRSVTHRSSQSDAFIWRGATAIPAVHYHVQASVDGGFSWTTFAVNMTQSNFDLQSIRKHFGNRGFQVRIITTDGLHKNYEVLEFEGTNG